MTAKGWAAAALPAPVRVASCADLPTGARIEARVAGTVHFEGSVSEAALAWSPSGRSRRDRKLVEFRNYEVHRH